MDCERDEAEMDCERDEAQHRPVFRGRRARRGGEGPRALSSQARDCPVCEAAGAAPAQLGSSFATRSSNTSGSTGLSMNACTGSQASSLSFSVNLPT